MRMSGAQSEILQFSAEGLKLLKKEASPQDGWISTHDALAALLWQVIGSSQLSCLVITLLPSLTGDYYNEEIR